MLHHVGIVCDRAAFDKLGDFLLVLGPDATSVRYVEEYQCLCAMFGGVELVLPDAGSKLDEWLQERGLSIHHFAVAVDDIEGMSDDLRDAGVVLVSERPVRGVGGILVNFIHPSEFGILIELVQEGAFDGD